MELFESPSLLFNVVFSTKFEQKEVSFPETLVLAEFMELNKIQETFQAIWDCLYYKL